MGFWPTKSKDKLYKQWAEHNGLPPKAIPKKEVSKETPVREGGSERRPGESGQRLRENGQRLRILYIVLVAAIVVLCVGVIILLGQV